MKTLLLITEHYLPLNTTPVRRMTGFVKYLRNNGWNCVVLTSRETDDRTGEHVVSNMPQDTPIYRIDAGMKIESKSLGYHIERINTRARNRWRTNQWHDEAWKQIQTIMKEHAIDAVMGSHPAPDSLELARRTSLKFQIPYVADFRDILDQWTDDARLQKWIGLAYERIWMRDASTILTVSDALADRLRSRHRAPVHVIPNGFDPDDINPSPPKPSDFFTILYTGIIVVRPGQARPLFAALEILTDSEPELARLIRLEMYVPNARGRELLETSLESFPAARPLVLIQPAIPANVARDKQRAAAVLFQISHTHMKGIMTSKVFEYLAARRPILAAPNDHDCVDELMRKTRAGVALTDPSEIAQQIQHWVGQWQINGHIDYNPDEAEVNKYSRVETARNLAAILDNICKSS